DNSSNNDNGRLQFYFYSKVKQERREIRRLGNIMGLAVLAFVVVQMLSSFILLSNKAVYEKYTNSSVFQNSFSIICVELLAVVLPFAVMALVNKKKYVAELVPSEKIGFGKTCLWVGFGMLCCIAANYIVSILSAFVNAMGFELTQSDVLEPENAFACVILVVSTAVVPAVCEEFAMRCCALGLLKKYGKAFGVVAVSIVFGLLHGNVIQFIFATLVGIILGFVTVKTNSIVPSVLIHGFNNGMSAFASVLVFCFGNNYDNIATYICFGFWLVVGAISLIILALTKQLKFKLNNAPKEPYANTLSKKLGAFISSPVLIISSLYLIFSVIESISKA
ncbi:MAG: CPBP family intramembrane metalloprotease, partial [Clostridiales bacterium]|nr:CPBP family intramembrane metalloprotease [Clostridiales bacterium]